LRTVVSFLLPAALLPAGQPIRGFHAADVEAQHATESRLRAYPEPPRARAYLRRMAGEPHHAGSPGSKAVAEYALSLFRQWGLEARIEEFEALLPFPTVRLVELTAPVRFKARLAEPVMAEDPDSGDRNQLPLYNAYSASGDVTGPLVYVNYGIPSDYVQLKKMGVDVKGKIVLARYGQSWRGTKAKLAQENGAIGCLIYSDPREDGYFQGDVFPKGPFRPALSAQRGSVLDMPVAVGDPLSPGWASEKGSRRLSLDQAATVMRIPVLPLSHADALPLLEQLNGPVVPVEWRGALPVTYHAGPGPAIVRIKTDFDWSSRPLYNVVARIPGKSLPDEWILYGNHHDAWVNGAADPVSGAAALLETARSFAELRKTGWQPSRTLLFALWDGEEFGLMGSTEWVEKHKEDLQSKLIAYLNSDTNTGGALGASGSPLLNEFLREVARDCLDPVTGKPLLDTARRRDAGQSAAPFEIGPLGAGSDYVAFQHHAGIPSLNLGFSKPGASGTYHSIYDSVAWFEKTMDKDYLYSRALAQTFATAILRMSESRIHPYSFRYFETAVRRWLEETGKLSGAPDLRSVASALNEVKSAGERFEKAYETALPRMAASPSRLPAINARLRAVERTLLAPGGLPGRTWYKHQVYSPGLYTGYSAKTLPAIREPLESGSPEESARNVKPLADALRRFAGEVNEISRGLESF